MFGRFRIRTDLALEARESFEEDDVKIRGVRIEEEDDEELEIHTTRVVIETENGAKTMGKPVGTYITMEAPNMSAPDEDYHREISQKLAEHLKSLMGEGEKSVLIVGLGNRDVTPDALGPYVVGNICITRHMIREFGAASLGEEQRNPVSGIVPGVMAQTGMETLEIIRGVVKETHPDLIIAVDALAARKMHASGIIGEGGENIITKEDIRQFAEAGADIILLPAPGTVPGITTEYVRKLISYAHSLKKLTITSIGTSQEGADTDTIKRIALECKMAGTDIHHIGDSGYVGMALPENIMAYGTVIRGIRHQYHRMAQSIRR